MVCLQEIKNCVDNWYWSKAMKSVLTSLGHQQCHHYINDQYNNNTISIQWQYQYNDNTNTNTMTIPIQWQYNKNSIISRFMTLKHCNVPEAAIWRKEVLIYRNRYYLCARFCWLCMTGTSLFSHVSRAVFSCMMNLAMPFSPVTLTPYWEHMCLSSLFSLIMTL